MKTIAVVPAAGSGKRMGKDIHKQKLTIRGIPILEYTLEAISGCDFIDGILLMAHCEDVQFWKDEALVQEKFPKVFGVLSGGKERQDTIYLALRYIQSERMDPEWIFIHDGVRPFVTQSCLAETFKQACLHKAAIAAVPVTDTIKQAEIHNHWIIKSLPRSTLWLAQTPQCFSFSTILKAHEMAKEDKFLGTDDASLVERTGVNVKLVMGAYDNIKITTAIDLLFADSILTARGGTR